MQFRLEPRDLPNDFSVTIPGCRNQIEVTRFPRGLILVRSSIHGQTWRA
jgi:hypothetical protein